VGAEVEREEEEGNGLRCVDVLLAFVADIRADLVSITDDGSVPVTLSLGESLASASALAEKRRELIFIVH
jgi:hypothetical protein